jgi:ribosome-binding protein aMBF1 (putative translation factor)
LATHQAHESRARNLSVLKKRRAETARKKYRPPAARASEAAIGESLAREHPQPAIPKTTGAGMAMGDLLAFRHFIMSLRKERERIGLSLGEIAARAKIDKAALSRLESGQQLNPTVKTLMRYARALGRSLTWELAPDGEQHAE